ncbi:3-oxoacyl-[acyl-carrier-protein] synthase III C-terminal domain-containing protein [Flavihumibacter stibioxidans]|uniref:3-oxoacyl-ACP synthase n=1 Tax=Flavihumibacter stibioxidans TaxID=1834163 RepID=A0ABR7MBN9_9BACT|nr:3-oxoacyl-[acyl-carrier-protein] synthase III C-terminal domain-containing protein [Flavihumibacter stibioxidans]MBC6492036.1 hypothetical protein [Flavihumibacter stibioxidans]
MDQRQQTVIESLGTYLPPQSCTTNEVLEACKHGLHFPLEKITGIKTRRMAGQLEFAMDLASNAVADCLARSKYSPDEIDMIICCNISRYNSPGMVSFEPGTSVALRQRFGFSNALVFDITNACAGMFTGIYILDAFLNTGAIRRGMVISGEYITHLTLTAQREIEGFMDKRLACLTLGDAGAAIVLEKSSRSGAGFVELDLQTLGRYSPLCIAKASENGGMIMYTDAVGLADVAIKACANHAMNAMEHAGWPADGFQHLIMHQTSGLTLNSAMREINRLYNKTVCHDGNTINNLEHRGNTASTSHFIALADQIRNKTINCGDKVVFGVSASGLTVGTALYVFDDLPERFRQMDLQATSAVHESSASGGDRIENSAWPRIRIESIGKLPDMPGEARSSMELLVDAATQCLERSAYGSSEIGLLIYSGVYRSEYLLEPAFAALLAGELGMNATYPSSGDRKTLAFDVFNGSVGFLNACYVGQQLILAGKSSTAMVVTSEIENNDTVWPTERVGIKPTASAMIIDAAGQNNSGFSRFLFSHHPEYINAYTTYYVAEGFSPRLHVEIDPGIESIFISCIIPTVREILRLEGLAITEIDIVIPPQVSAGFIKRLSEALGYSTQKFIDAVGDGPDLFTSSIPYAMDHLYEDKLVKTGDIGLIITVGSGIQVGCAIYHF